MNNHYNSMILTVEPFVGFFPDDLHQWLNANPGNSNLAAAMAAVSNHTGSLLHELGSSQDCWIQYAFGKWRQLEQNLYQTITESMTQSNQCGITNYDLTESRLHYRAKPFMEKHGYYDSAGWWIKSD